MNRFEEYLRENKEKLGTIDVDPVLWISIENELLRKNNRGFRLYLRIAASLLILIASASIIKYAFLGTESNPQYSLSAYSSEYGQMEKDFQKAIYFQTNQVLRLEIPSSSESDFKPLTNELKVLDNQYKMYSDKIEQYGYDEEIGNKVLEYYSLKLELLKKIQLEIIKINNFKKNNKYENNNVNLQL